MKPYYADESVTLYLGDCLEVPEWLAADVLVTDPPYGTLTDGTHKGGYGRRQNHDSGDGVGASIANDETTQCRDRALSMWGNRPAVIFASPRLPEPPGKWDHRLVWDKSRPGMNAGPWRYTHEAIYARGDFERRRDDAFSIFRAWPGHDQQRHIHAKPVPLIAARNLGRKCIGVEVDERYCEVIARRLAQGVLL